MAHNAHNALVLAWKDMKFEPGNNEEYRKQTFALTYLNNALLSYISALGSQRYQKGAMPFEISVMADDIAAVLV